MNSNIVCIYAQPRTGSCFLTKCIDTDSRYLNLEEAFSPVNVWGITILMHCVSNLIRINHEKNEINKNIELKPFLQSIINYIDKGFFDASINDQILIMIKEQICDGRWNIEKIPKAQNNIMFKLFHHHIEKSNLDLKKIFKTIDILILNYRKNNLLRWISEKRAFKTNKWIQYNENELNNTKIIWNKTEYLKDFEIKEKEYKVMFKNYKQFKGPKAIICYEDIHEKKDKIEELRNIFLNAKIDIDIKCTQELPKIQSNHFINVEENFENKSEFLKDFNYIKNNIEIKMSNKLYG